MMTEQEQQWQLHRAACLVRFQDALIALLKLGSLQQRRDFLEAYTQEYGLYAAESLKQAFKRAWDAKK